MYTVNLPKTNFSMKANLPSNEPKILEFWDKINLYQDFVHAKNATKKFVLHDGPPYANGDIHLGHAFNKILKDIINKSKLLDGYKISYVPGWDCHGLPIELNIEKKFGRAGTKISIENFIKKCRIYAAQQIQNQMQSFKRLGVVGDWSNFYSTMDFKYEANIVRSLAKVVAAGYLIRGRKAVHWCPECGSALAEAELEYKSIESPTIDVKFTVVDPQALNLPRLNIPIWTTTPWTLPANEAVALNSDFNYLVLKCKTIGEYLLVAEELIVPTMTRYGEHDYSVISQCLGKELEGILLKHPFMNKTVPIILGNHVTAEMGTGAVHTAPAHGAEDYEIGIKYQLTTKCPVGSDGKFLAGVEFFGGCNIFEANSKIIELLRNKRALLNEGTLNHNYPHCWRHKTKLIFRTTDQWFISMDKSSANLNSLRNLALNTIEKINWIPTQGQSSITSMIKLRPDWCISRQRFWGIPITLFIHRETEEIHPEMFEFIAKIIAPNIEKEGLAYWHKLDVQDFLNEYAKNSRQSQKYLKVQDSLDVWFNSGVSHYCVLKHRENLGFPADLYVEGSDQYRGWFQSSLLTSLAMNDEAPYQSVITHGFCVDSNGHKMSKSLGNVIGPEEIIKQFGADILRLWVGSTYPHDDLAASKEIFTRNADLYRMLRNTARFLLGNLSDFHNQRDLVESHRMVALDRLVVNQFLTLTKSIIKYYNSYQFHNALSILQTKLVNNVSGFYFSVVKDRLYTMAPSSHGRRSVQTALFYLLEILVRILAPIISFTAEEIWQELIAMERQHGINSRAPSVFMSRWIDLPDPDSFNLDQDLIQLHDWERIQICRDEVNKALEQLRITGIIGSSLEAEVTIYADRDLFSSLSKLHDELRFILITSTANIATLNEVTKEVAETGIATNLEGLRLSVTKSAHKKCCRCWHHVDGIGLDHNHPELCPRCIENLFAHGEIRQFA